MKIALTSLLCIMSANVVTSARGAEDVFHARQAESRREVERAIIDYQARLLLASVDEIAPPSYEGDSTVYKVIYEDATFRVIEANRPAGVKDQAHGHPMPGFTYYLTDCVSKQYTPDGKVIERVGKAGSATPTPIINSHQVENTSSTACKQLLVEKK